MFVLAGLVVLSGCGQKKEPDYFPLVPGARKFMKVYSRKVVNSDTSETTQVRLSAVVRGEKELSGIGKVWVVESPRDSGPSTYAYFRKQPDAVIQVVPMKGRDPLEVRYLSLPLSVGKSWYDTEEQREQFEVVAKETIELGGHFFPDCYKVAVISSKFDWAMHHWFAPDVGPVKWESRAVWTKDGVEHELVRIAELVQYQLPGDPGK